MTTHTRKVSGLVLSLAIVFGSFAPLVMPMTAKAITTVDFAPTTNSANGAESWSSPTNAYSDGSGYASNPANDEKHIFGGFGISLPTNIVVDGIEVLADAWSEDSDCRVDIEVSRDGGSNWSSEKSGSLGTSEATVTYGDSSDDWFPSTNNWTSTQVSNLAVRVQAEDPSVHCSSGDDIFLDFLRLRVYYTETEPTTGNYVITGTGVVTGYTVNLSGYASSTPYVGNINDQHISIDWDEDADGIPDAWLTEDSNSSGNDAGLTPDITFDIDSYGGSGSHKYFVDNNWTATHTYATGGAKKIFVRVHHATPTGAEGSDFGTIEINVVIVPPENTLGTCSDTTDNDGDGLVDLADPDCASFIPTLTVTKIVTNNNGGTAVVADFPLFIDGFGVTSGVASTTSAGLHTVSETNQAGYTGTIGGDCAANGTITLAIGDDKTCTITNDDQQASLTVTKEVHNIRKDLVAGDFDLTVGITSIITGIAHLFDAGTYAVGETNGDGYNTSFGGDCDSLGSITLGLGETKNCTIVNTEKTPGTLHIIKVVENDNAVEFRGSASPADFTLSVTGGNPDPSSVVGADSPGTSVTIDGDAAYEVLETDGPSGYGVTYSADCDAVMPEGGEKTCTVTNNDTPPTQGYLTVRKHVTNNNGGEADASAWTLNRTDSEDNTTSMTDGLATLVEPDTYAISETGGVDGYEQTSIMCSTDGGSAVKTSSITVDAGHSYVCTITNDDIRPTLILEKHVTNDDGGQAEAGDWTVTATGDQESPTIISGNGTAQGAADFQTGTYTLSESDGPPGYTPDETWSCVVNDGDPVSGNSVTLGLADTAICSITNDDEPGTLIIQKTVVNDNGGINTANDFFFRVGDGSATAFNETADDDDNALTGENTVTVNAGTYTVTEDTATGYGTTLGAGCSGTIANGETKTCTITNNDGQATLHIVKQVSEGDPDETFDFKITGDNEFSTSTSVTTTEGDGSATISIDAGTYSLEEVSLGGWTVLDEAYCTDQNGSQDGNTIFSIEVAGGDDITCTFYNDATGFDVTTTKTVDDSTPDAGQNVTFTLTLTNAGPAGAFNLVTQDVLPAGLTYVSDNGGSAYATSSGTWFVSSLPAASSTSLQIVATVTASAGQTVTNFATTTSDGYTSDYNESNDNGSVSITVNTPSAPTPTPPSNGGGGGGGGGGVIASGPLSIGYVNTNAGGQVLGAATGPEDCNAYLTGNIRFGKKNDSNQVTKLQEFLNNFENNSLAVTGVYDAPTLAAVNAFQKKYAPDVLSPWGAGLPTGFVYHTTKKQINTIYCKFTKQFPLSADQQAEINRIKALGQAYTPATAPDAPTPPKQTPQAPKEPEVGSTLPPSTQSASVEQSNIPTPSTNFWGSIWDKIFGR